MKNKCLLLLVCLIGTVSGLAKDVSSATERHLAFLFEKYANMDNVVSVSISKAMFQAAMPIIQSSGLRISNLRVESLQLLQTNNSEIKGQMQKAFLQVASKRNGYKELMRVRDSQTQVYFFAQTQGTIIKTLLMFLDSNTDLTIIQITGNFTIQEVQEMTMEMGSGRWQNGNVPIK
jgi:hypothetical protein